MKSTRTFLRAAVAVAALSPVGLSWAGGTHTVNVSATVTGTCVVNSGDSTLVFGTINPSAPGPISATPTSGTFRCTNGTAYTVSSNGGQNASGGNYFMKKSGASDCTTASQCIKYTFSSVTSGSGLGMANNISFNVSASTTATDYQNAEAGSYADVVTLTVAP